MPVQIADSVISAATKLGASGATQIWTFLGKFMENPAHPGLNLERVEKARDPNLWSARISRDLRCIVHKDGDTYRLLYADHHDAAYAWAADRRIDVHRLTGVLSIIEPSEVAEHSAAWSLSPQELTGPFARYSDDELLSLGLPLGSLPALRHLQSEEELLEAAGQLSAEAGDRLLDLASGKLLGTTVDVLGAALASLSAASAASGRPDLLPPVGSDASPRFYVLERDDELQQLLDAPLAAWAVFLHPSQRRLATGSFKGPVKVTGSAGTGKTVVALHRARHLARAGRRILLTSFVTTLCRNLEQQLRLLCTPEERARITVDGVHSQALALVRQAGFPVAPLDDADLKKLLADLHARSESPFDPDLLRLEWESVIRPQGITTWDEYRKASRAGRGIPLSIKDRQRIWPVFAGLHESLERGGKLDWSGLCLRARELLEAGAVQSPYDTVLVDEVQDLGAQELRFLAVLAGNAPDALTLVGDGGQRIYSGRFSLRSMGIDVRGRSHTLRINYRTTEQIRRFADRIAGEESDDLDGGAEDRRGTRSLLHGPEPILQGFSSEEEQTAFVVRTAQRLLAEGLSPEEIAVFSRRADDLKAVEGALRQAEIASVRLGQEESDSPAVRLGTMHRAKGLEFKVVFVIHASDDRLPLPHAYRKMRDPQAREEGLLRERQLLYVSLTRARDEAYLTWAGSPSRFLPGASGEERGEAEEALADAGASTVGDSLKSYAESPTHLEGDRGKEEMDEEGD